jgi:hypothetical protein
VKIFSLDIDAQLLRASDDKGSDGISKLRGKTFG